MRALETQLQRTEAGMRSLFYEFKAVFRAPWIAHPAIHRSRAPRRAYLRWRQRGVHGRNPFVDLYRSDRAEGSLHRPRRPRVPYTSSSSAKDSRSIWRTLWCAMSSTGCVPTRRPWRSSGRKTPALGNTLFAGEADAPPVADAAQGHATRGNPWQSTSAVPAIWAPFPGVAPRPGGRRDTPGL